MKSNIDYIAGKIPMQRSGSQKWILKQPMILSGNYLETFNEYLLNHERVGGIVLWTPWQGNRWREQLRAS
jgi:hypothetical protein